MWARFNGVGYEIQAATRPAGGSWQAPLQIGFGEGGVRIAEDIFGAAVATWSSGGAEHHFVHLATRSSENAAWSAPVEVGDSGYATPEPNVALGADGEAVVVWASQPNNPGTSQILAAMRPAGGQWSAPVAISRSNTPRGARAAVDEFGNITAVWEAFDGIETAYLAANSSVWVTSVLFEGFAGSPSLAADVRGSVIAAWVDVSSGGERLVYADFKRAKGTWEEPRSISPPSEEVAPPGVAIGLDEEPAVVWAAGAHGNGLVRAALKTYSGYGAWAPSTVGDAPPANAYPQIAVDDAGNALAVWWSGDAIESSALPAAASSWQPPAAISGPLPSAERAKLALDEQGNGVAIWQVGNGYGEDFIRAAGYDAAGPQLNAPKIPPAALVGEPVSFDVAPLDVWSAVASTSWSFGDGAVASGSAVSHAYSRPGVYVVTLSSVDALGNVTTGRSPITVSALLPTITHVTQTAAVWRRADHLATVSRARRIPVGTTFSFALNEPARVTFTFTPLHPEQRCGGSAAHRRRARACVRGSFTFFAHAGVNRVRFYGRISRDRALSAVAYTLAIAARDSFGQLAHAAPLRFTISR